MVTTLKLEQCSLHAPNLDRTEDRPVPPRLTRPVDCRHRIRPNKLTPHCGAHDEAQEVQLAIQSPRLQLLPPLRRQVALDLADVDCLEAQVSESRLQVHVPQLWNSSPASSA